MRLTRRTLLRGAALPVVAPAAAAAGGRHKTLVVVMLRGGADGLNMVVPYTEPRYYELRPTIAVPRNRVIDLDDRFGLHPLLAPLKPLYDAGRLAIVQGAGGPRAWSGHFAAQEFLDQALSACGAARYSRGSFSEALRAVAEAIRDATAPGVVSVSMGGWDHHVDEAGPDPDTGALAVALREFGAALAAFDAGLGARRGDVVLVALSEFGRTARENRARGTGHGYGNCMFVLGRNVQGGRVAGRWPGLGQDQLHAGRSLACTTDVTGVLAELLEIHAGVAAVFPGLRPGTPSPVRLLA